MKITTWNLNGIRSLKKSVETVLSELSSDVTCFQETKVSRSQLSETTALVNGYTSYFSYPRKQSGYSGVAIYCKDSFVPEDAEEGLSVSFQCDDDYTESILSNLELVAEDVTEFDSEGRSVTTYHLIKCGDEIRRLAVINVYCPRVDPEKVERHLYKMQFCYRLELKMRELVKKGCSVIIVGDMNISFSIIDSCDLGDEQEFNSSETRMWFKAFLNSEMPFCDETIGVKDAFRHFYPDKKEAYTCWNTKTGARQTNYGTRIDYILLSTNLLPLLQSCEILSEYQGSDHCPVSAVLKCDPVKQESVKLPAICTRLWPEFSGQQQKLQTFFKKTQAIADSVTQHKEPDRGHIMKNKPTPKKNKQKSITNFFKAPTTCQSKSNDSLISTQLNNEQVVANDLANRTESSSYDEQSFLSQDTSKTYEDYNEITSSPQNSQSTVWKSLLSGPPKAPLCSGHKKECVLRTVKKKGANCGRQFFMCALPAGDPRNPDASCNFFQWVFAPKHNKLKK